MPSIRIVTKVFTALSCNRSIGRVQETARYTNLARIRSALCAFETRLDPVDRAHAIRRIDAFGRIDLDVGDNRLVLRLVPACEDAVSGRLNALVTVVEAHGDRIAAGS